MNDEYKVQTEYIFILFIYFIYEFLSRIASSVLKVNCYQ